MTALKSEVDSSFAFGPFLLVPDQQLLLENQKTVRIGQRGFDLLTALVEQPGQVVGKRELLARVWPGLVVDEGNLKVNIAALRRQLGEGSGPPRYIATVVGRGYRFIAPVRMAPGNTQVANAGERTSSLPLLTKRIFGRESAIGSILHDLEQTRLVSIVGPGGVGKTTVALAVADRAARNFADGACFVDLSTLEGPSQVAEAIAETIAGLTGTGGKVTGLDTSLRNRELLILLDNCEHLIGAVAQCADRMLACTKGVKLLVTSREAICIRGERVRHLNGLGLPSKAEGITAMDALAFPAVQLFAERAAEQFAFFRLDDANAPSVSAICHRLDGHALAIERVAQRVGGLGVAGMLDHIDRRFHMFDGYHEGPERHRTLTAAVDASYILLSPGEQATMRSLSIFLGAFNLEAACVICGAEGIDPTWVVDNIASLVAKSVLAAETLDGEMQFRQAHVTRAFAMEQLIAHGELAETQRRHSEYSSVLFARRDGSRDPAVGNDRE